MNEPQCFFDGGDNPFPPAPLPPPQIGSLLFVEGPIKRGWRVIDVQYRYGESPLRLVMVQVVLAKVAELETP